MNLDDETGFPFEHFAYWNRWLPRSKSLMNPFWLLSSSTHDWALLLAGFVKIGDNFCGTHVNSNSQTCSNTYTRSNTQHPKAYTAADFGYVYYSHHNWVGDSLFGRGLVTLQLRNVENVWNCLESLVRDVIISTFFPPIHGILNFWRLALLFQSREGGLMTSHIRQVDRCYNQQGLFISSHPSIPVTTAGFAIYMIVIPLICKSNRILSLRQAVVSS